MILRGETVLQFADRIRGKTLVCFGSGRAAEALCEEFASCGFHDKIFCFIDNAPEKWGTAKELMGRSIPIRPPEYLRENADRNTVVLISGLAYYDMYRQLDGMTELAQTDCYIDALMRSMQKDEEAYGVSPAPAGLRINPKPVIPRVIHYFWFSGDPLPEFNLKCIESWRRFCPDYDIVHWNKSNYDINRIPYTQDAARAGKWSALSDYSRLDIVCRYGGIYMDVDVELLAPLDELLYNDAYAGFEAGGYVNLGSGFGAVRGNSVAEAMRDDYEHRSFHDKDAHGEPFACPVLQTEVLERFGLKRDGSFQRLEGITIYPSAVLSPKSVSSGLRYITEETVSVHHYDASWFSGERAEAMRQKCELMLASQK